mmetsp:Transcript_129337/g.374545  ORF Transcript_129337/g.374545 Transcript_129337/m.374545 type:complete len:262 (-) Transcript_129337:46-831(-)
MLDQHLDRRRRAYALQGVTIVATRQDAEVDELIHGDVQLLEGPIERHLVNCFLLRLRSHQVPDQDLGSEGQAISILGCCGIHLAVPAERCARGFGFAGGVDNRDAHEPQQGLRLLVLLLRNPHGLLRALQHLLGVAGFDRRLKGRRRLVALLPSRMELAQLQLRWLTIEHVDRLDAILHQADRARQHSEEVRCHLSVIVGQVAVHSRLVLADHDHELVQTHARVDGKQAAGVRLLAFNFPDSLWRCILQELHQPFNPHGCK